MADLSEILNKHSYHDVFEKAVATQSIIDTLLIVREFIDKDDIDGLKTFVTDIKYGKSNKEIINEFIQRTQESEDEFSEWMENLGVNISCKDIETIYNMFYIIMKDKVDNYV